MKVSVGGRVCDLDLGGQGHLKVKGQIYKNAQKYGMWPLKIVGEKEGVQI